MRDNARPSRSPGSRTLQGRSLKALLVALVLLLAAPAAQAQYAGAFARLGLGGRALGMGGVGVADLGGGNSGFVNPALVPFTEGQRLEATFGLLSFDREIQRVEVAAPLPPRAGFSAGLVHYGVGEIDGRDGSGYSTGTFATDEYTFFLAFGLKVTENVAAGLGLKVYQSDLFDGVEAASSLTLGAGLAARLSERLSLGLTVQDLLGSYEWDTTELYGASGTQTTDRFPVRFRLGGQYLIGRFAVSAEANADVVSAGVQRRVAADVLGDPVELVREERVRLAELGLRLGGEYRFSRAFALRAGVDGLGTRGVLPAAGFSVRQQVGELDAAVDVAALVSPELGDAMSFVTIRLHL